MTLICRSTEINEPIFQGKIGPDLCYLKLCIHVSLKVPKPLKSALLEIRRAISVVSNEILLPTFLTARLEQI